MSGPVSVQQSVVRLKRYSHSCELHLTAQEWLEVYAVHYSMELSNTPRIWTGWKKGRGSMHGLDG